MDQNLVLGGDKPSPSVRGQIAWAPGHFDGMPPRAKNNL